MYNITSKETAYAKLVQSSKILKNGWAYWTLKDYNGTMLVSANSEYILNRLASEQWAVSQEDIESLLENNHNEELIPAKKIDQAELIIQCVNLVRDKITWGVKGKDYMVFTLKSKNAAKKIVRRLKFKSLKKVINNLQTSRDDKRVAVAWEESA